MMYFRFRSFSIFSRAHVCKGSDLHKSFKLRTVILNSVPLSDRHARNVLYGFRALILRYENGSKELLTERVKSNVSRKANGSVKPIESRSNDYILIDFGQ